MLTFIRPFRYQSIRRVLVLQDGSLEPTLKITEYLRTIFPNCHIHGAICEDDVGRVPGDTFDKLAVMRWEDRFCTLQRLRTHRYDVVAALHRNQGRCSLKRMPYYLRARHILIFNENYDCFPIKLWKVPTLIEHYGGGKQIAGLLFKLLYRLMAPPAAAIYLFAAVIYLYARTFLKRFRFFFIVRDAAPTPIAGEASPAAAPAIQHRSSMDMWNEAKLDSYANEPALRNLLADIDRKTKAFDKQVSGRTCRGNPYGLGGMRPEVSIRLYGLVREFRPTLLVETGVCNGVSTAVILAALERNNTGSLYSIDFPEYADTLYPDGTFWEGKMGAVVPKGKQPGWMIPDMYRARWQLTIGKSMEKLPTLLEALGNIDFFLHDSEHSYECMTFEYQLAWNYLKAGGLLVSDDIGWNSAFKDFAEVQSRDVHVVDRNMAFIIK